MYQYKHNLNLYSYFAGYFLYDSIDMYLNNKLISNWEVTLHHIAVSTSRENVVVTVVMTCVMQSQLKMGSGCLYNVH